MKTNNILFLVVVFITTLSFSQETALAQNQNPNYKVSLDKYLEADNDYVFAEGTTLQETYVAIDLLEERRQLRSLRREHRANRALWRHQERMERAKNGYSLYDDGYYNDSYYNNSYRNSNWINSSDLLSLGSLGLLGYYIFR